MYMKLHLTLEFLCNNNAQKSAPILVTVFTNFMIMVIKVDGFTLKLYLYCIIIICGDVMLKIYPTGSFKTLIHFYQLHGITS
jgi:hypothetical protein